VVSLEGVDNGLLCLGREIDNCHDDSYMTAYSYGNHDWWPRMVFGVFVILHIAPRVWIGVEWGITCNMQHDTLGVVRLIHSGYVFRLQEHANVVATERKLVLAAGSKVECPVNDGRRVDASCSLMARLLFSIPFRGGRHNGVLLGAERPGTRQRRMPEVCG